jgi:FG-GAP repeat
MLASPSEPLKARRPGDRLGSRRLVHASWVLCAAVLLALLAAALVVSLRAAHPGGRTNAAARPRDVHAPLALAAELQADLSATLGARDPAYRIAPQPGPARGRGYTASNPGQQLRARFAGSLASIGSGPLVTHLRLAALGYGSALHATGPMRASASHNALRLTGTGIAEWYHNGPLGLEQGFTIANEPPRGAAGTLTIALALSGNAHAALARDRRSITLAHAGRTLRYGALSAVDAAGHPLDAWLSLARGKVLLSVAASRARYPIRVDPFIAQAKLVAGSVRPASVRVGRSVALSADGNTALVGVPLHAAAIGSAVVFSRAGTGWSVQAILPGGNEVGETFYTRAVALSADGNVALIGNQHTDEGTGRAWLFTRSGVTWTARQELGGGPEEGAEGKFGTSVALSADGSTALVGASHDQEKAGAAWVFARSGEGWTQQGPKLSPSDELGAGKAGASVALSADGDTALLGAPNDDGGLGAAWVFTRSGTSWTQQGHKLLPSDEPGLGHFGHAVSISGSGDTALIGGFPTPDKGTGAAWIFQRSGDTWSQQGARLQGTGAVQPSHFGSSVAISSDAKTALIGGSADDTDIGAAWVFTLSGSSWSQQGPKLLGEEEEIGPGQFGWSVALSEDASTALIGAIGDDEQAGAAWVFTAPSSGEGGTGSGEGGTGEGTGEGGTTTSTSTGSPLTPTLEVASFHATNVPALESPVLAESGNITQVSGAILVLLPGSTHFTSLKGSAHIPFGTIVDATHGVATITVAGQHGETETARYFGGRFLITQRHDGMVVATLEGGNFAACRKRAKHASAHAGGGPAALLARSRRRPVRKLWTNAHGRFTTKGTYAAGAVQGTEWLTEDFCNGTLVIVTRDRVKVTDRVHHRTHIVRAGHRVFVKSK